jgi:cyclic beta-1,2-glucan synthetase
VELVGDVSGETDRALFLGRGRSVHSPRALDDGATLTNSAGAVLDPVVALRARVRLEPGRAATVAFTTAVAADRQSALRLADRYRDLGAAERALSLASTEAQVELRDLGMSIPEAAHYQELAAGLIYPRVALRTPATPQAGEPTQKALWAHGISGDWPIVLATIKSDAGLPSVRKLLAAHQYWRIKGVRADLVLLNAKGHSYAQDLHDQLTATAMASSEGGMLDRPGGLFIRRADGLTADDLALLRTSSRVQILCDGVGIGEVITTPVDATNGSAVATEAATAPPARPAPTKPSSATPQHTAVPANGYGALADDGAFVTLVSGDSVPPAPWANVIANPVAGFCVTERGGGFAWVENSHFFRLTPWFNDPVTDPCGETLDLEDRARGERWTPTPGPAPARGNRDSAAEYVVRHAPGITTFAHERAGIVTELSLGMAPADPVKISRLRLTNRDSVERRITLTSYVEWSLGAQREHTQHQITTWRDETTGALCARNFFAPDFASRIAFSWLSEPVASHTSRRAEFIGRNGGLAEPDALHREALSGESGPGHDPCAALRAEIVLAPGEVRDVVVLLGAGTSVDDARALIARHGVPANAEASVRESVDAWNARLSCIVARTPDSKFDAMLNRWSLYQALACRMWARSALYQSSGAYGFRDQLQDSMAFVYAVPGVAREHLLRAAGRQFVEGDVQHWWHEPSGRGVRTRFSDDLAWLPFVADHYVRVTGDREVWDATAPFLTMRPLAEHEHEIYDLPTDSGQSASLYEHCVRALDRACTTGAHGLPLMGTGDWNDGMNLVGAQGKGESVWLAWFLTATLRRFAVHAEARGDSAVAARCRSRADAYVAAVERHAWDGAWYLRAYFDDGATLGSSRDAECQIDAIAQSWSVLSEAGDVDRARTAMQSVNERLVRDDVGLVLLLAPPFDRTDRNPGYIKGYLPGVRENGAQYTHAALWTVLAFAGLGDGDRAHELLSMINPLSRAETRDEAETYKVEPYVIAADVYAAKDHVGRGGWTWYTGSASWNYRVALEGILGFAKHGDQLAINPCIPRTWPEFSIEYRYGSTPYSITVRNPDGVNRGVASVELDGAALPEKTVTLRDDGSPHTVVVTLGNG